VPGTGTPVAPEGDDEFEDETAAEAPAPAADAVGATLNEDGTVRRRRRRRRRRGRGGATGDAVATDETGTPGIAARGPVPDRHIFRVDGTGSAEPTGKTAPPEPGRAIARVDRKTAHVAVEAPPRSLTVPEVAAKVAKPTRRGRKADDVEAAQLALASSAPEPEAAVADAAPRRRGRPRKTPIEMSAPGATLASVEPEPVVAEKPKRGRPKAAAVAAAEPEAAVDVVAAPKRAAAKKTTGTAKKAAAKAPARKAAAAPAARKASASTARKKTPAAATATRKKTR
jgi:hypothetical protein